MCIIGRRVRQIETEVGTDETEDRTRPKGEDWAKPENEDDALPWKADGRELKPRKAERDWNRERDCGHD